MQSSKLTSLTKLFLKLGIIGFGGPAAHIALMKDEVVNKKAWMDEQHFLDLVGATNLIPGPNSTELAIHIGKERAGLKGLFLAGICFILPAVLITGFFAWLYKSYGSLPQIQPFMYGMKPAIIVVILAAILPLAQKAFKSTELISIGIICLGLSFLGVHEIFILFGAGLLMMLWQNIKPTKGLNSFAAMLLLGNNQLLNETNLKLFLSFLKIGSILYGSGYVLFSFLDTELVAQGLLSKQQLMDAITVGQFTPGPVFSAVTFIGYQINGWSGALVSTIGIFLPSFLLVWLLNPLVPKMRQSTLFSHFLDAVNVASIALIAHTCYQMGETVINDWRSIVILISSILVVFFFKNINSVFIILGSALLGYTLMQF